MEEFIKDNLLSIVLFAIQGLWGWAWWSLRKQFVSVDTHTDCQEKRGKRLGELEGEIIALEHRLEIVEREVKALPTVQGINTLTVELEKLRGEMQGFRAEMQGQRDFMKRTERQITLLIDNELRVNRNE